jgi:hypothetical protein
VILIGEAYWRRMYAEHHPDPRASHAATPAHAYATIAAYERVGWLAGKKTPIKPKLAPRKSLERRLRKLESEAAQLREQLKTYPADD